MIENGRLRLRRLCLEDAAFILELQSEDGWKRYIGDRGVRDIDTAGSYLLDGPMAMYQRHGHGLYCVERRDDGERLGLCGLLRRDGLEDPDLGFAFLARHCGQGHAREAAKLALQHARHDLGLGRIVAITLPGNAGSIRVLDAVGFGYERRIRMGAEGDELCLYGSMP